MTFSDQSWANQALLRTKTFVGYRGFPYDDKTGSPIDIDSTNGKPMIGSDLDLPLSEKECLMIMCSRMNDLWDELLHSCVSDVARDCINNRMLGMAISDILWGCSVSRLLTFDVFWDAMRRMDYGEAGSRLLETPYAKVNPRRSHSNADLISNARFEGYGQ